MNGYSPREAGAARVVSEDELGRRRLRRRISDYWAGEIKGTELELTGGRRRCLVRHLEEGDEVGAAFGRRLAVGSYALPNHARR